MQAFSAHRSHDATRRGGLSRWGRHFEATARGIARFAAEAPAGRTRHSGPGEARVGKSDPRFRHTTIRSVWLPVSGRPNRILFTRGENGFFTLQITGHPEFELPFGQDRLVPIFLSTLAVRQQSQTIRFKSAAQMLDTFGMAKGGKEYRRLVAAFERIFGATIFFGTDSVRGGARVVHRCRFNFLREAQIWYDRDSLQDRGGEHFENVIVLSDEFYNETLAHPIPTDVDAVKVLASAPAVLDLFMWLVYRCFISKREEQIPLFGDFGLTAQLGSVEYTRPRRFRAMVQQWLSTIRTVWPECPAKISSGGRYLSLGPAKAIHQRTKSLNHLQGGADVHA